MVELPKTFHFVFVQSIVITVFKKQKYDYFFQNGSYYLSKKLYPVKIFFVYNMGIKCKSIDQTNQKIQFF